MRFGNLKNAPHSLLIGLHISNQTWLAAIGYFNTAWHNLCDVMTGDPQNSRPLTWFWAQSVVKLEVQKRFSHHWRVYRTVDRVLKVLLLVHCFLRSGKTPCYWAHSAADMYFECARMLFFQFLTWTTITSVIVPNNLIKCSFKWFLLFNTSEQETASERLSSAASFSLSLRGSTRERLSWAWWWWVVWWFCCYITSLVGWLITPLKSCEYWASLRGLLHPVTPPARRWQPDQFVFDLHENFLSFPLFSLFLSLILSFLDSIL